MERNEKIDIMKGILIISVVVGHSGAPFTKFIYLFHMVTFFMISGYLFKEQYSDTFANLRGYTLRKIKRIWLPYFIWSFIFLLTNNLMINTNLYPKETIMFNNQTYLPISYLSIKTFFMKLFKAVFFSSQSQMGGTFWYFKVLFGISILYAAINLILIRIKVSLKVRYIIQTVIGTIFLMLSFYCSKKNIVLLGIPVMLEVYLFYHVAFIMKNMEIMNKVNKKYKYIVSILSFIILLLLCLSIPMIDIGKNVYINPLYLIVASLAGWFFIYGLSTICNKFRWSKILSYIGKYSISIMILHFLCFKLVTLLQVYIYNEPIEYLAVFPVLHTQQFWWLAYTVVGVGLPLALNYLYITVIRKTYNKQKVKEKFHAA